jgi:two-component system, NtrC family, sensor kinase
MGKLVLRTSVDGGHVRIDIQDNGAGIPPDVLPKIFDPFFTTKKVGEGTGTGLSICYRIIENHGGRILVNSRVGMGTTFTVLLPMQPKAAPKSHSGVLETA